MTEPQTKEQEMPINPLCDQPKPGANKRAKKEGRTTSKTNETTSSYALEAASAPYTYKLHSRVNQGQRHTVQIKLSIPAHDEECPLTLEPIAESKLQFLPDTPFLKNRPLHSKLTLECGHSFSAMPLIYSFCKNGMTCPCCRAGEGIRLDPTCLPTHFRLRMKEMVQKTLETERAQDDTNAMRDILSQESFNILSVTVSYEHLADRGNLRLVANFHRATTGRATWPLFSVEVNTRARRNSAGQLEIVPTHMPHTVSNAARMGINSVQLSMQLCLQGVGSIVIDSTATTPITESITTIPGSAVQTQNNFYLMPLTESNTSSFRVQMAPSGDAPNATRDSSSITADRDANPPSNQLPTPDRVPGAPQGLPQILEIAWIPGVECLELLSGNVPVEARL